jgi:hypothetical protein
MQTVVSSASSTPTINDQASKDESNLVVDQPNQPPIIDPTTDYSYLLDALKSVRWNPSLLQISVSYRTAENHDYEEQIENVDDNGVLSEMEQGEDVEEDEPVVAENTTRINTNQSFGGCVHNSVDESSVVEVLGDGQFSEEKDEAQDDDEEKEANDEEGEKEEVEEEGYGQQQLAENSMPAPNQISNNPAVITGSRNEELCANRVDKAGKWKMFVNQMTLPVTIEPDSPTGIAQHAEATFQSDQVTFYVDNPAGNNNGISSEPTLEIPMSSIDVSYFIEIDDDDQVTKKMYLKYKADPDHVMELTIGDDVSPFLLRLAILVFRDLHYRDLSDSDETETFC